MKEKIEKILYAISIMLCAWVVMSWGDVIDHNMNGTKCEDWNAFVLLTKDLEEKEEPEAMMDEVEVMVEQEMYEAMEPEYYITVQKKKRKFSKEDKYLLAKIAMAEAEDQDIKGKELVICVVLNRVKAKEFPSTIKEVIFQKNQFSPIADGRWDRVEPNKECYKAVKKVAAGLDESKGATYFEMTQRTSTWHSRTLHKLFEHQDHSFYKE